MPERLLLNAGPLVGCFAILKVAHVCQRKSRPDPRHGNGGMTVNKSIISFSRYSLEGYLTCLQLKSFFNTGVGGYVTVNLWAESHLTGVAWSCTRLPPLDEVITATLPEACP